MKTDAADEPLVDRVVRPFQQFFATDSAGGIVVLACTVVALVWANSARGDSYFHVWERTFTLGFGGLRSRSRCIIGSTTA